MSRHKIIFPTLIFLAISAASLVALSTVQSTSSTVRAASQKATSKVKKVTLNANDWQDFTKGASVAQDGSKKVIKLSPYQGPFSSTARSYPLNPPGGSTPKIEKFVMANLGKKGTACITARLAQKNGSNYGYFQLGNFKNTTTRTYNLTYRPGQKYKTQCKKFAIASTADYFTQSGTRPYILMNNNVQGGSAIYVSKVTLTVR
ncbi:hypothetical protein KBC77_00970 [Candidatus Saccharibacteria bacterium]|nr:hypothetical protein [Candidatus Saccharibacteria bacterium]